MTLLEQLNAWQEEIQELKDQCSDQLQGLTEDLEKEISSCATAVSSARNIASGRSQGLQNIPRAGQSERRIDLSVRGYIETNPCGVIQRTNNASALLLNFPRHLLVGQPLLVFIQKEERKAFLTAFLELRHRPKEKRHEYLVMIHPVSLEPQLAMLIAERVEDPDNKVLGITWLLAPA